MGSIVELHDDWASIVRTSAELLKGRDAHRTLSRLSFESLIELDIKSVIRGEPLRIAARLRRSTDHVVQVDFTGASIMLLVSGIGERDPATFARRNMTIESHPAGLRDEFAEEKSVQWTAFIHRSRRRHDNDVLTVAHQFSGRCLV